MLLNGSIIHPSIKVTKPHYTI